MHNASGAPTSAGPEFTPALLSTMLRATADNLDRMPIALVVEEALYAAHAKGWTGAMALTEVTWALRDTAAIVDNLAPLE